MDAIAYLKGQGWRGDGHSLDKRGLGIKKPLLITHKQDQLGLGKKKAAHNLSDQWWMRAFDDSLKTLGTGSESALSQIRKSGVNRGGLYGFFVQGEGLAGTIFNTEESSAAEASNASTESSAKSTPPTSAFDSNSGSDSESDTNIKSNSNFGFKLEMSEDMEASTTPAVPNNNNETVPGSKKRKRKQSAAEIAEQRKSLRQEAAKLNVQLKQKDEEETAVASNAYENGKVKRTEVLSNISRQVNTTAKRKLARGEYGPVLAHPSKAARKKGEANPNFIENPDHPGKKLTYKAAKYAREKKMRDDKKALRFKFTVEAMLRGELENPNNYSPKDFYEDLMHNLRKEEKEAKQQNRRLKEIKEEEKRAKKAQQKMEKQERREQKRIERDAKLAESRKFERLRREQQELEQDFSNAPDKIDFTPEMMGQKMKNIPGYGLVEKYPTKAEKRARKETSEAEKLGLSLEEYRAKIATENQVKNNKNAINAKLESLSDEQRAQYTKRAALKGQSLEDYILRRIQKKDEKKAELKAEKRQQQAESSLGFVVDTEGNKNLLARADKDHVPEHQIPKASNGSLPLDPAIWEGRPVKSLTKEERNARKEWMRQRRIARKIKKGENPAVASARKKTRAAKKMDRLGHLTGKILRDEGKAKTASKQEVDLARKRAKKVMKEEKKLRKGKGKKLVENLKGRHRVSLRAKGKLNA